MVMQMWESSDASAKISTSAAQPSFPLACQQAGIGSSLQQPALQLTAMEGKPENCFSALWKPRFVCHVRAAFARTISDKEGFPAVAAIQVHEAQ